MFVREVYSPIVHLVPSDLQFVIVVANCLDDLMDHPGRLRLGLNVVERLFDRRRDCAHYTHYHCAESYVTVRKSSAYFFN